MAGRDRPPYTAERTRANCCRLSDERVATWRALAATRLHLLVVGASRDLAEQFLEQWIVVSRVRLPVTVQLERLGEVVPLRMSQQAVTGSPWWAKAGLLIRRLELLSNGIDIAPLLAPPCANR